MVSFALIFILGLTINPGTYTFPEVEEGEIVTTTFTIINDEEDTLFVKSIKPSCGCTYTSYISGPIPPGDSVQIEVSFNTKGYSGEVVQSVKVNFTNGRTAYLELKGRVIKTTLSPDELSRYYLLILDIRDKASYDLEHLAGSIWVDKEKFQDSFNKMHVSKNTLIVIVGDESKDREILKWLKKEGYGNSYFLKGGIENWKRFMRKTYLISEQ